MNSIKNATLFILFSIPVFLFSQMEFKGVVKDKDTNTELEDVLVFVKPLRVSKAGYYSGVKTRKNGAFNLTTTYNLPLRLEATKAGCKKVIVKIKGSEKYFEILMECEKETIDAIVLENNSDNDGDSVINKEDNCPDEAGDMDNGGCPWPDDDNDGVANNIDECPDVAGKASNKGCPFPDSDDDGVEDSKDDCPNEPGDADKNGCPANPKQVADLMTDEDSSVLFQASSSAVNEMGSTLVLEIATMLSKYPFVRIIIEGHASSDGSRAYNQKLSEERAQSVKSALESSGVDVSRVKAIGYGEDRPIATNSTREGRAKNRRVVFVREE